MQTLGRLYAQQGRYGESEPLFAQAVDILSHAAGEEQLETLAAKIELADLRILERRYGQAEGMLSQILPVMGKSFPDRWTRYNCQSLLGAALAGQKKFADVEPLLVSGYEGMQQRTATINFGNLRYLRRAAEEIAHLHETAGGSGR